jgi:hypothetical protein
MSTIIRVGQSIRTLTFRTNIVTNPLTTPFDQVLAWLCQRRDYYSAASVALSLLDDFEAVYELRGVPRDKSEALISHQGLLDSVTPLANAGDPDHVMYTNTLTSLADMTVGCLIKGGSSMASTLEGFLFRNKLYDSSRASLMLVGTIALVISSASPIDSQHDKESRNIVDLLSRAESPSETVLWPVKCIMIMATARDCLSSALLMLNATIPNELRWRPPHVRGVATAPRPPLGLFLAIVDIILESTSDATRFFLDLIDEESGFAYWFSIEDDTRLALSLFSIHGKHVMIQQPEVRAWILERLKVVIETTNDRTYGDHNLPDDWLREVIAGVFCNAECDIGLGLEGIRNSAMGPSLCADNECYRQEMLCVQDLLIAKEGSGGLDFDILIPSLLLLCTRDQDWREGSSISTQILLNTVCDLAGRKTNVDPRFLFDARTVMRQCGLAENIQAAAFLIGGRNGLVLECADLLITNVGISMRDAEIALFGGSLVDLKEMLAVWHRDHSPEKRVSSLSEWTPSTSHHHILWLIQHHVLNVSTYGEFDSPSTRGKINPVPAGRTW